MNLSLSITSCCSIVYKKITCNYIMRISVIRHPFCHFKGFVDQFANINCFRLYFGIFKDIVFLELYKGIIQIFSVDFAKSVFAMKWLGNDPTKFHLNKYIKKKF